MDTSEADSLGLLNYVDHLASGDVLKWEAVTMLENSLVQVKLMRDGIIARAEYNARKKE